VAINSKPLSTAYLSLFARISMIDHKKYREAILSFSSADITFEAPPAIFVEWLEQRKLPLDLSQFLIENALSEDVPLPGGAGAVWSPQTIMCRNDERPGLSTCSLLAIASAGNGDLIALDFDPNPTCIGFISYAEIGDCLASEIRSVYIPVAEPIHDFFRLMTEALQEWATTLADNPEYPVDYYSARASLPGNT